MGPGLARKLEKLDKDEGVLRVGAGVFSVATRASLLFVTVFRPPQAGPCTPLQSNRQEPREQQLGAPKPAPATSSSAQTPPPAPAVETPALVEAAMGTSRLGAGRRGGSLENTLWPPCG